MKANKIGLIDVDTKYPNPFPNLALCKIAAFHRKRGYEVGWCVSINEHEYEKIYVSSVFTFNVNTDKTNWIPGRAVKGGTGFDIGSKLPDEIDDCKPDFSIYPGVKYPIGFLTRGCIRKCPGCLVPEKEGDIRPYRDIADIIIPRVDGVILMDNNVLACDYGIHQVEKIIKIGIKVDFNQGLDARLIDDSTARLLSKVKWLRPVRLACDNLEMIAPVRKAIELLRWHNCRPSQYFVYVLVKDIETSLKIIKFLKGMYIDPFAQNYVDPEGKSNPTNIPFCNWVNIKKHFMACTWEKFRYRNRAYYLKNKGGNKCQRSLF